MIGLLRYWKLAAGAVLLAALLWERHSYGVRHYEAGIASQKAAQVAAEAKATAEHDTKIEGLNREHHDKEIDLATRLQAALDKPPAVRIVRMHNDATCQAPIAPDAGQPQGGSPEAGSTGAGEEAYRVFRDGVLRLGADAEKWRRAVLDAQEGWPK